MWNHCAGSGDSFGPASAAAIVPRRLTASSGAFASCSDVVAIHSTLTRCGSRATAVRHGRVASAPAVDHGADATSILSGTSGGGSAAFCSSATSASISPRIRHGSGR